jgi:hypothetical protein
MKDQFYVILNSVGCPLTKPNNTASNFTIDLENTINLEGKWKVGLTDFSFLYRAYTIKKGTKMIIKENDIEEQRGAIVLFKGMFDHALTTGHSDILSCEMKDSKIKFISKLWEFELFIYDEFNYLGVGPRTIYSENKQVEIPIKPNKDIPPTKYKLNYNQKGNVEYVIKNDEYFKNNKEIVKYFMNTNCFKIFEINNGLIHFEINKHYGKLEMDIDLAKIL